MKRTNKSGILLVANWDSNVGYAWWLMESFWIKISEKFIKHETHLAYPSISEIPKDIERSSINIHKHSFVDTGLKSIIAQYTFLRNEKIQYIYFSDKPTWSFTYWIYRAAGVKSIIIHDHTPGLRKPTKGIKRIIKSLLHKIPGLSANLMIATSDFIRNRHIEVNCIPSERCYVASNGIPILPKDFSEPESNIDLDHNKKYMVMTGRANKYKGIDQVIRCLSILKTSNKLSNLHFVFVGDGPDLSFLIQLAKDLGVINHCMFVGRVSNVNSILAQCDLAVHPSSGEVGYSLSILEYMRASLPVIVPNNPSVCGATTHMETGYIYKIDNLDELANAIHKLSSDDKLRTELGRQAKRQFETNYSLEKTHRQLIQALGTIITDSHNSQS